MQAQLLVLRNSKEKIMYKLTAVPNQVKRLSDNAYIPFDPANTDYVAYLAWLEAGNQPLPAEE
jgi:hypothetical protein